MATSLKISKKESDWSSAIQYLPYGAKIVKIGPADPEIYRLRANQSATTQNWLPWQRPLRNWKKMDRIDNIHTNTFLWWKGRENRSSRSWDSFAQFKKRKKLTQAKYIARSAGLPSGLNQKMWCAVVSTCRPTEDPPSLHLIILWPGSLTFLYQGQCMSRACPVLYISTDFGVDSSSRFNFL